MTNPLSLLTDLIPQTGRRYLYAVTAGALFVYSIWQATSGDIRSFLVALGSALVATLATANTPASKAEVTEAAVEMVQDEPQVIADAIEANDVEQGQFFDGHANFPRNPRDDSHLF